MKKLNINTSISALLLIFLLSISILVSSTLQNDEEIIFIPTYGKTHNSNSILVNVHGWIFKPQTNSIAKNLFIQIIKMWIGSDYTTGELIRLEQRAGYFFVDTEQSKEITIKVAGKSYSLNKSHKNGHAQTEIELTGIKPNTDGLIFFSAQLADGDSRIYQGAITIIPEEGLSIISDIDDTIKESNVLNKKKLIENTFLKNFKAVSGMSRAYIQCQQKKNAIFHYVSGSPWQLFVPLKNFLKNNHFPQGSMHLKYFGFTDSSGISFIQADPKAYKLETIKKIINDFPKRNYILIGDSGEKDLEIYAEIAALYPTQIVTIYIRNLGNISTQTQFFINAQKTAGFVPIKLFSWRIPNI